MMVGGELAARIDGIETGPWAVLGAHALKELKPPTQDRIETGKPNAKPGGTQLKNETKRLRDLHKALRAHYDDPDGITDDDEIELRDSLDEALTKFQLYELAIQTGYLELPDVSERIHRQLQELLWFGPVQQYLLYYDFIAVRFLARRVGFRLSLPAVNPPEVIVAPASMFGSFLSQHRLWYEDQYLNSWLDFLDDKQCFGDEDDDEDKELFWRFLKGRGPLENVRFIGEFADLLVGASRFIFMLAELNNSLPELVRPRFAQIYAYWMAKNFGYELEKKKYSIDAETGTSWGAAIAQSTRFSAAGDEQNLQKSHPTEEYALQQAAFRQRLTTVRQLWDATKQFINQTNRASRETLPDTESPTVKSAISAGGVGSELSTVAALSKFKPETVSTRQLASALAEKHAISQKSANAMLEDTIGLITKHLKKGARIRLNGLGILVVRKRAARMGRSPTTGEAIEIKASKNVAFKPSKQLKEQS